MRLKKINPKIIKNKAYVVNKRLHKLYEYNIIFKCEFKERIIVKIDSENGKEVFKSRIVVKKVKEKIKKKNGFEEIKVNYLVRKNIFFDINEAIEYLEA